MREIDMEKIFFYIGGIGFVALLVPVLAHLPRNRGRNLLIHVAFAAITVAILVFVPKEIQLELFSPGGVLVIGTLLPVYQSVIAVCTTGESDDETWLQYWIAFGFLLYATEFVHDIRQFVSSHVADYWFEFHFFFTLWLMLPFTDGATLLFDVITRPYIAPIANKIKARAEGWYTLFLTFINSWYIWILWYSFISLPEDARRFLVIALGTVYPMAASMAALVDRQDEADHTYWLTFWSSYSLLFAAMDYLENFVGQIPLFHSACALATVYLFLPMFGGAEVVFRRILVPLTGQYENMLVRDAYLVKARVEKAIPEQNRSRVMEKLANLFKAKQN